MCVWWDALEVGVVRCFVVRVVGKGGGVLGVVVASCTKTVVPCGVWVDAAVWRLVMLGGLMWAWVCGILLC